VSITKSTSQASQSSVSGLELQSVYAIVNGVVDAWGQLKNPEEVTMMEAWKLLLGNISEDVTVDIIVCVTGNCEV
jgi:hypothetical protein